MGIGPYDVTAAGGKSIFHHAQEVRHV